VRAQEPRDADHATLSTSEPSSYQRLREHLAYLEMTAAAEHLADELDRGTREKASPTQVLERLLTIEADATRARRLRGRLRFARYPIHKTLAEFDLDFQPSLDRKVLGELSTLRFVEERRNVILLGPPGVGKSHLAIALGIAATEAGYPHLLHLRRRPRGQPAIRASRGDRRLQDAHLHRTLGVGGG
jgi:DNA replication protein DnaC